MELSLARLAGSRPKPLSVLCCSKSIDLVEAELQHALLVNVGSAHPAVLQCGSGWHDNCGFIPE
jgi:hypothetical protein